MEEKTNKLNVRFSDVFTVLDCIARLLSVFSNVSKDNNLNSADDVFNASDLNADDGNQPIDCYSHLAVAINELDKFQQYVTHKAFIADEPNDSNEAEKND